MAPSVAASLRGVAGHVTRKKSVAFDGCLVPAQYELELIEAQISKIPERAQSTTDVRDVGTRAARDFGEKPLLNGVVFVPRLLNIGVSAFANWGTT